MAEWGCTLQQALFPQVPGGLSLGAILALWPALLARHGVESTGNDYTDRCRRRAKRETRKWLAEHYTIKAPDGTVITDYAG